jgi:hypothetical protein
VKVHIGPYRKNRKVSVQIDNYDIWNMNDTLALIIYPMLIKLRDSKAGYPFVDNEDVPEHLRVESNPDNPMDDSGWTQEKWHYVLDEMIYAFEQNIKEFDNSDDDMLLYDKKLAGEIEHDEWLKQATAVDRRIRNGFRLFGKYYGSLWT